MALLVAAVVVAAAEVAVAAMAEVAERIFEASEPRTFARLHATGLPGTDAQIGMVAEPCSLRPLVFGFRHQVCDGALLPLPRLPGRPAGRGGEHGVRQRVKPDGSA